jgi:hypothetical protein
VPKLGFVVLRPGGTRVGVRRVGRVVSTGRYFENERSVLDGWVCIGSVYLGTGDVECERVVIVEYGTRPGEPAPKGIITSFGRSLG